MPQLRRALPPRAQVPAPLGLRLRHRLDVEIDGASSSNSFGSDINVGSNAGSIGACCVDRKPRSSAPPSMSCECDGGATGLPSKSRKSVAGKSSPSDLRQRRGARDRRVGLRLGDRRVQSRSGSDGIGAGAGASSSARRRAAMASASASTSALARAGAGCKLLGSAQEGLGLPRMRLARGDGIDPTGELAEHLCVVPASGCGVAGFWFRPTRR